MTELPVLAATPGVDLATLRDRTGVVAVAGDMSHMNTSQALHKARRHCSVLCRKTAHAELAML
jgi:hypothetical protein